MFTLMSTVLACSGTSVGAPVGAAVRTAAVTVAVTAPVAVTITVAAPAPVAAGVLSTLRLERNLAVGVDVLDDDGDFVSQREHVLHPVDASAASDLGDVEQTVTSGQDVDEGAELGDVDDTARVGCADLGRRWIKDQLDLALSLDDVGVVDRRDRDDADHAVVVD